MCNLSYNPSNFRILVQYTDKFKAQANAVPLHIKSDYTSEMSTCSKVLYTTGLYFNYAAS